MPLTLYFHPLASFCQKVLIALYENDTAFEGRIVDLGDPASRAAFLKVWPVGKFPVIQDTDRGITLPESSIIIEYLALHYPGAVALLPPDPGAALLVRLEDRLYDLYVEQPVQKIVTDKLRPEGQGDAFGVEHARGVLRTSYQLIDQKMAARTWASGDVFTMADCAAAPALFYANLVEPIGPDHRHTAAYLARLMERPSFARVVREAQPYFHMFPG